MLIDVARIVLPCGATAILTWAGQAFAYSRSAKQKADEKTDRLEIHRDELTFELLQNARTELSFARSEMEELRGEVSTLRNLERHVYHFQQSLDHLEAILNATTIEERASAERNARAFLNRMRRLNEAKGTVANEIQARNSEISIAEQGIAGVTVISKGGEDVDKI